MPPRVTPHLGDAPRRTAGPDLTAGPAPRRPRSERPPRAMAESAQRGNRRRAWPRWTRPAVRAALFGIPLALFGAAGWQAFRDGVLVEAAAAVEARFLAASAGAGFALAEVLVEGRTETERVAVLRALGVARGDPIFGIDLEVSKARLEQLPWVSGAAVERRLPDVLYIRLSERQPMAIWQHERRFTVIDREGRPLADATELARRGNERIATLPQVVGANAPQHVPRLLAALEAVPTLLPRMAAAVWVGDRRWDLKLDNGVMVKLPEDGMPEALRRLAEIEQERRVLDRDIVAVDLRQPGRMVLQTSATAVIPGLEEQKKKAGKKI